MAEDSDEDVLFSNSPLMQHLVDTGIAIQLETFTPLKECRENYNEDSSAKYPLLNLARGWWSSLNCWLSNIFGFSVLKEETNVIENIYKEKLINMILKSKALEIEDQQFLENYKDKFENQELPVIQPFIKSKLLFMVAFPCVLAYLFSRVVYPDLPWSYKLLTDLSALCTLTYLLTNLCKYLILWNQSKGIESVYNEIVDCIKTGETLVKYLKKSLRLIQESELISRGFTLMSHQSPVSRLEQNSLQHTQRQCPQLRSTLFCNARNCFLTLKTATKDIITEYPLDANIDSVMNYLCHISLEDFGQCLQVTDDNENSMKQLCVITDGFSIAALKGVNHLCHLQLSEFLRRLTLTFIEKTSAVSNKRYKVVHLIENLGNKLQTDISKLQRSYDIHSCCKVGQETTSAKLSSSTVSPLSDVHVAVHSLDLHLQAALLRIRSLSTVMEHQIEKGEDNSEKSENVNESLLKQVQQELLACKGCWEEGLSRVENLLKTGNGQEQPVVVKTEVSKPVEQKPILQCGLEDLVIEDEVFEAYNDEDEEELGDNVWDEFLTHEEREKKKKEKEEALRLLSELKSVISVRAKDTAKREQIALEKAKGGIDIPASGQNTNSLGNIQETDKIQDSGMTEDQTEKFNNPFMDNLRENENTRSDSTADLDCRTQKLNLSLKSEGTSNEEPFENVIRPRKQKYVYCPPEDEMNGSIGTVTSPQFIGLPVLGKHQDVEMKGKVGTVTNQHFVGLPVLGKNEEAEERLGRLSGANLPFTSMLAAEAVARSHMLGLNVRTFGDDNDDCFVCDNNDSSDDDDWGSRDSLNDESEDDSLKDNCDNQFIQNVPKDKFDDNDSLIDDCDHDLNDDVHHKCYNHDSDDSLELTDEKLVDSEFLGKEDDTSDIEFSEDTNLMDDNDDNDYDCNQENKDQDNFSDDNDVDDNCDGSSGKEDGEKGD